MERAFLIYPVIRAKPGLHPQRPCEERTRRFMILPDLNPGGVDVSGGMVHNLHNSSAICEKDTREDHMKKERVLGILGCSLALGVAVFMGLNLPSSGFGFSAPQRSTATEAVPADGNGEKGELRVLWLRHFRPGN